MTHSFSSTHCEACGQAPCAHADTFAPRKRGPRPKPHANREKITLYVSKALRLAIAQHSSPKEVSVFIREKLEEMFPDHRTIAEKIKENS